MPIPNSMKNVATTKHTTKVVNIFETTCEKKNAIDISSMTKICTPANARFVKYEVKKNIRSLVGEMKFLKNAGELSSITTTIADSKIAASINDIAISVGKR